MEEKLFCETCRNFKNIKIVKKEMIGLLKGKEYKYIGKEAICSDCGSPLYSKEVNDFNLNALYDSYRKENNIISLDKIKELPEKYNIGKRPLSVLLGWGDLTYTRYLEGYIPSKQYSDTLERIYDDPLYFEEILEENKGLIKDISYKKSKEAIKKIINTKKKNKINLVADYILYKCEDVTPLALQKLLYYVQGFYFAFNKKFIFENDCQAWQHGPVYYEIYKQYKDYCFNTIRKVEQIDETVFSDSEKIIINSVIKNFGCYSGKTLERFTHLEKPWGLTRGELPYECECNKVIEKDYIANYFIEVLNKYKMETPNDISLYSKKMFRKTY